MAYCCPVSLESFAFPWDSLAGDERCRDRFGVCRTSSIFLGIFVFLEIAIVFYLSFVHTLGWDGLLNWEIKAHYAFANGGVIPATYFSDSGRAFSHPEYPLAIPFTELWLYLWLGEADQLWAKTIFPIFYVI